ncbi:MAG TPA: DUF6249 domain-containing protein [Steroidobacteraceae bacterium]|nr:DUF6249 domain-containing protein [Steroidobacteraceae bacterium]
MDDSTGAVANVAAAAVAAAPGSSTKEVLALMIPIIAIVMGIGIGMLALWLDYRKKRDIYALHHKERLVAIEKGMDVPPLPDNFFNEFRSRPRNHTEYLRKGLIWLLIGVAVIVAMYYTGNGDDAMWGLVPAAFGAANLLYYFIPRKGDPS